MGGPGLVMKRRIGDFSAIHSINPEQHESQAQVLKPCPVTATELLTGAAPHNMVSPISWVVTSYFKSVTRA